MPTSLLIKHATVISVDPDIGVKANCDILIQEGVIEEVAQNISEVAGTETFDATNCIVSPGWVDTHHHLWQQLLRGVSTDWSLANYVDKIRNLYGSLYTPEDVYVANKFAALDLINNGITSVVDHCHILNSSAHTDAAITGLKDGGIRGTWCYGFYENPTPGDLPDSSRENAIPSGFDREARKADAKRAREQHFSSNDPAHELLTFGGAPSEAELTSQAALQQEIDFFRSIGARIITMHVAIGNYDRRQKVVQHLGDAKYLCEDLLFSHGSAFTDSELQLIQETGAGISVTPETELQMGMGHPVAFRAAQAGCNVGLGIDITSNQNNDMLAVMRLLLQAERSKRHLEMLGKEPPIDITPKSEEALYMATMGGARIMGMDHLVGSVTPGKRADLIITRCDDMNMVPITNPIGALMHNAHIGNIDTVLIDGKPVKSGGQVLNNSWPALRKEVRQRTARLVAVAASADAVGIKPVFGWNDKGFEKKSLL
jgi:cytosine/adenosine deaminase-related metal-dependent hydrolase